jgi:uncharacterized protein YlaI
MLPIKIKKLEQDIGVCLTTMCPHCQRVSQFKLRQRSAALFLYGYALIDFGGSYDLFCSLCAFRKDLDDSEFPTAKTAKRLHDQLTMRELDSAHYSEALDALDFPTYRALRDEAVTWLCPVCKEKVPATLNGCWKCSSPRPGLQNARLSEEDSLPRLPSAVTRPSNPWE